MGLTITEEVYKWLLSLEIIKQEGHKTSLGRYELSMNTSAGLESGIIFAKIAKVLAKNLSKEEVHDFPFLALEGLKNLTTPHAKLFNWNILSDAFKRLGIPIDPDLKNLIIGGDTEMVNEYLKEVHTTSLNMGKTVKNNTSSMEEELKRALDISGLSKSLDLSMKVPGKLKEKHSERDSIDLGRIDSSKQLSQAESLLEFFIISLARNLQLKPKQAASLFTKNNKYLAHVFAKGVKNQFEPIINFYQDCFNNVNLILGLMGKDESRASVAFGLHALKPGLISKNSEVAAWCAKLISKMSFEFAVWNLQSSAWDWFVTDRGGLHSCMLALRRHPQYEDSIAGILTNFGRYNISELFTVQLKKILPDPRDFFYSLTHMLKGLSESSNTQEDLINSGIIDDWLEFAFKTAEQEFVLGDEIRTAAMGFLTAAWITFTNKFEENEARANGLLGMIKKITREKSSVIQYTTITYLIRLLENFGHSKNPFAPVVYKTLTLIIVENHQNITLREFMLNNFMSIFESIESIPLSILLDPLVKQIQVSENSTYIYNVFDFNFFSFIARQDRLNIKNAIQMLDILAKIYLNNVVFAPLCSMPMLTIITRHIENETLQEFLIKFIKISLAMYYASDKKKKPKEKVLPMYNNRPTNISQSMTVGEMEVEIINAQKRSLIVEMIKNIVNIQQEDINEKIKSLVVHTNIQIKNYSKKNNKGMMAIISLLGKADEIIRKYEEEYYDSLLKGKKESQDQTNFLNPETGDLNNMSILEKSQEHHEGEKSLLKSHYIGQKSKLTKEEMVKMALLRNPKADPKILNLLQDIKKELNEKQSVRFNEEEEKAKTIEKQKSNLRKALEKRSIEQGVSTKNQNDLETNLIFPEGTREKDYKKEKKHGLTEIEPINIDLEEESEQILVKGFYKTFNKILKHLYIKYGNSGFGVKGGKLKQNTFDDSAHKSALIDVAEMWKLLKEHSMSRFITQEQMISIVRAINVKILKDRKELQEFDYDGFLIWLLNIAVFIYSKPPKMLSHMPVHFALQELLNAFKEADKARGLNTILYDDPETTIMAESDVLKELNSRLQEDPEYVLPEGFKKMTDKKVDFHYDLPSSLEIPEGWKVAYECLDDILNVAFGFQCVEPQTEVQTTFFARPKIVNSVEPKVFNPTANYMSPLDKASSKAKSAGTLPKAGPLEEVVKRRVLECPQKKPLSFTLKMGIAKYDPRNKYIAEEVAYVIEDMLFAVEEGKSNIDKKKIVNQYMEYQKKVKELEEEGKLKLNERRKQRREEVHEEIKKKNKEKEEEKKAKEGQEKKLQEEQKAKEEKKKAKKDKMYKDKKDSVTQKKENEAKEEEKKKQEEEEKKKAELEDKKKKFKEFNSKQRKDFHKEFEDIKVKRNDEEKTKTDKEEGEKKRQKEYKDKVLPKVLEKHKKKQQEEHENNQKIKDLIMREDFAEYFTANEKIFKFIFNHGVNITFTDLKIAVRSTIPLKTLSLLTTYFRITPVIFKHKEIILIFKSLTKKKELLPGGELGLNYEEFLNSILRICIKGQQMFNAVGEKLKASGKINEKDMTKIIEDNDDESRFTRDPNEDKPLENENQFSLLEKNNDTEDIYKNIDKISAPTTLNGFLYYIGCPLDPNDKVGIEKWMTSTMDKKGVPDRVIRSDLQKKLEAELKNSKNSVSPPPNKK